MTLKGIKRAAARRIAIRIEQQLKTAESHGLVIVVQDDGQILVVDAHDHEVLATINDEDDDPNRQG
ncbi:MAG: hypothetical protein AAFS10_08705 [Myxococcota bacterium]